MVRPTVIVLTDGGTKAQILARLQLAGEYVTQPVFDQLTVDGSSFGVGSGRACSGCECRREVAQASAGRQRLAGRGVGAAQRHELRAEHPGAQGAARVQVDRYVVDAVEHDQRFLGAVP